MKDFLKKIKLIDTLILELPIGKMEFNNRLKATIDIAKSSLFSDLFSSSNYKYNGSIKDDTFELKRKKKMFDTTVNHAKAKGIVMQEDARLIITTEINGFHGVWVIIGIVVMLFYPCLLFYLLSTDHKNGMGNVFSVSFIILHGLFMLGISYLMMRSSVKKMKYDLEREYKGLRFKVQSFNLKPL